MDGIAAVQARISEITARFQQFSPTPAPAIGGDFSAYLDRAHDSGARQIDVGSASKAAPKGYTPFATDLLTRLGMPVTSENVRAVVAWARAEGTAAANNPLATTQPMEGATRFNSAGVRNYSSYQEGLEATVRTLQNGRYDNVLAALRAGTSADDVGRAVAASPWGTGEGVLRVLRSDAA